MSDGVLAVRQQLAMPTFLPRRGGILQRHAATRQDDLAVPPIVHEVLRSPGRPLDPATRATMEPRLGHDFSQVRVHTDAKAAESARAVNALAYAVGHEIVFVAGQYDPGRKEGKHILAHELAHVMQQSSAQPVSPLQLAPRDDASEREADAFAARAMNAPNLCPQPSVLPSLRPPTSVPRQTIQRVSFGKDGELSSSLRATVQAAAEIVARRIMAPDFEGQWDSFWKRYGKAIKPQPPLESYRNAVKGRVVHDMDSSKNEKVKEFLKEEAGFPLERQTAAVSEPGSRDTYMRRFAIQQGVESVVSLLLHESWHGAGIGMGPLEAFEIAFHAFETGVGYPMMMGGGKIEAAKQKRRGDTGVEIAIAYSLHKIGKDPLPSKVELQVAEGDSADVVHQQPLPSKVGRNTVVWQPENPGWNSYSIRIRNADEDSLMAAERIETNPRCVLGVSTMHCESD